ncbi:MAG: biotin--[acetyl-CoA-carboxylase] ligase [Clostridia bacterium]
MTLKENLLTELENNLENGVCGQEIAEKYSVSRNAVWKAIQALRKDGYEIGGLTNRGYRLLKSLDIVSEKGIREFLADGDCSQIFCFDCIDSTNAYAMRLAENNAPDGALVVADKQTSGRGRIGRTFDSPSGGIYMSVIIRPRAEITNCAIITPMAAVAVAQACEKFANKQVDIKWVNDIYSNGKKLCGIMSQATIDLESGKIVGVVVGIGVNFCQPKDGFADEIKDKAGALFDQTPPVSRNCMIAQIYNNLRAITRDLTDRSFLAEYRRRSVVVGREIKFEYNNVERCGKVTAIDDEGGLEVVTAEGKMNLTCGEVSIKPNTADGKWL